MRRLAALAVALCLLAGCSRNPVLGDWELDRGQTEMGAMLAAQAAGLEQLRFERGAVVAGETRIEGSWVVEQGHVRFVRADGSGEHAIELLDDGRIDVELPIGVHAIYREAGSG
jgi:hypothetical protein